MKYEKSDIMYMLQEKRKVNEYQWRDYMKDIKRLNFILALTTLLLISSFIVSCRSNPEANQNLNMESVNRVYPVFATETISAISIKALENNNDIVYLLYENSPDNTAVRSATDTLFMEGLYSLHTGTGSTEKATEALSEALKDVDKFLCLDGSFVYIKGSLLGSLSEAAQLNWEMDYPNTSLLSINTITKKTHGKLLSLFIKDNTDEYICMLLNPLNGETISQTTFNDFMEGNTYYGPFQGFESPLILSKGQQYHISNSEGLLITPILEETERIVFLIIEENSNQVNGLNIFSVYDEKIFKTTYDVNGNFLNRTELTNTDQITSRDPLGSSRTVENPIFDIPPTGSGNSAYFVSQGGIPQIAKTNNPPKYTPEITFVEDTPIEIGTCNQGNCLVEILVNAGKYELFHVSVDGHMLNESEVASPPEDSGVSRIVFLVPAGSHKIKLFGEHNNCYSNTLTTTIECVCSIEKPTLKWSPENPPVETTDEATTQLSIWSSQPLDSLLLKNNGIPETVSTPLTSEPVLDEDNIIYLAYGIKTILGYGENYYEVFGINENGTSNLISHDTNGEFEALSFTGTTPVTVFPCEDGKCRVSVFIHSNHPREFTHFVVSVDGLAIPQSDFSAINLDNGVYDLSFDIPPGSSEIEIFGNDCGHYSNSLTTTIDCNCPGQPPLLSWNPENTPPETTTEETVEFTIQSDQEIDTLSITVNDGVPNVIIDPDFVPGEDIDDPITLNAPVELALGNNSVSILGENENGQSNTLVHTITRDLADATPTIAFAETPPSTITNCEGDECTIAVKISSSIPLTTLMIKSTKNETPTTITAPMPDNDGNYPLTFTLVKGQNYISILAVNDYGYSNNLQHFIECICPN
jgi:hypothetical protein